MTYQSLGGVAVAGACGAVARYTLHLWATRVLGERFPWATLCINVLGCLFLGCVVELVLRSSWSNPWLRVAIPIGLLGGFTTFSTFSYETLRHAQEGHWGVVFANILGNVLLGLMATACGIWLARSLTQH